MTWLWQCERSPQCLELGCCRTTKISVLGSVHQDPVELLVQDLGLRIL